MHLTLRNFRTTISQIASTDTWWTPASWCTQYIETKFSNPKIYKHTTRTNFLCTSFSSSIFHNVVINKASWVLWDFSFLFQLIFNNKHIFHFKANNNRKLDIYRITIDYLITTYPKATISSNLRCSLRCIDYSTTWHVLSDSAASEI